MLSVRIHTFRTGARQTVRIIRIASDADAPPTVFVTQMKSDPLTAEDKTRAVDEDRKTAIKIAR